MPRASTMPGEMLSGGFFRAGKYLILAGQYAVHQFHNRDNQPVGNPSVMMGLEMIQLADKDNKTLAPDAVRLEQWYPVGGNLEMFYPSDADDKKVDKGGQFVGSPTTKGIFEDSPAAQFATALINAGYDPDRWRENDVFGLPGSILVLSEIPDKKAPAPEKTKDTSSRMAQEAAASGAQDKKNLPRVIIAPSEVLFTPDDVHGAELPKAKWPKGTPATVTKPGDKKKDTPKGTNGAASRSAEADTDDSGSADTGELSEEDLNALLQEAAKAAMKTSGGSCLDPILKGKLGGAINELDISEDIKSALKDMANDQGTRSAAMTNAGFVKSGATWKAA